MKYLRSAAFFLSTLVLYLGFPLFGWGLDDVGGFFSSTARFGYAALVAVFGLAVGWQAVGGTEGIRGGKGEAGKLVRRQSVVRVVMILALYAALTLLPFGDRRSIGEMPDVLAAAWVGLGLSGLGFLFVFWSGYALGKQYSPEVTIQEGHKLVTGGPYRVIRHPRYLGVILLAVGLSLLFHSWIGLAAAILFTGILVMRIKDEEAMLHREFGPEWESYCRKSWRLIPFIY